MKQTRYCLILFIMVSCSPGLNVTITKNAKQLWQQHKTVAIIPMRITSRDNDGLNRNDYHKEMQAMMELSLSFQINMYKVLQKQYASSNLSVQVMAVDSTAQMLAANGITFKELPAREINKLCTILNVDAVIAGVVDFYSPDYALTNLNTFPFGDAERAKVELQIFDKNFTKPIWSFSETGSIKNYDKNYKPSNIINGSNEKYLTAYLFDKAMKILPYVIKSPVKRWY
jgi:hypothetical protein